MPLADANPYGKLYGLKINPFPLQGSFPLDSEYEQTYAMCYTADKNIMTKIDEIIKSIKYGEASPVILVIGGYGFGKTHLLRYMYYRITQQISEVYPIYIKNITEPTALSLYKATINGLYRSYGREFFIKLAEKAIKLPEQKITIIRDLMPVLVEILPKIATNDNTALRWLFVESLSADEINELKIIHPITEDNAVNALQALVKMIYYTYNIKLILLIDELEETIAGQETPVIRNFYKALRDIVDTTRGEIYYVFATSPIVIQGARSIPDLHPALFSRIRGEEIWLKKLSKDMLIELARKYLSEFRIPRVKYYYDPLYPFTEESIEKIYEVARGVPRTALRLLGKALQIAARKNKKTIDPLFIDGIISGKIETEEKQEKEEIEKIIEEAIEGSEEQEIKTERDLTNVLKRRTIKRLEKAHGKTLTLSELARILKVPYDIALKTCREMQKENKVVLKRAGRGYRVYLRLPT